MNTVIKKIDSGLMRMIGQRWWSFTFNFRMDRAVNTHPEAGYYERVMIVNGFDDEERQQMIDEAIQEGRIDSDNLHNREEVFFEDISYWG